jgi:GNAT superfamily N-acetyltransferase
VTVRVVPADEAGFAAVEHALTGGGDGASCWCRFLLVTRAEFDAASRGEKRDALRAELRRTSPSPGLVALAGDEAAGWVRVGPRPGQPGVLRTQVVRRGSDEPADADDVWAVTCFVVRREHRGEGLAGALLGAAIAHARTGGVRVLEGYPVDPVERPEATSAELWHGTTGLFTRAGFTETARPTPARPVMTLRLG